MFSVLEHTTKSNITKNQFYKLLNFFEPSYIATVPWRVINA